MDWVPITFTSLLFNDDKCENDEVDVHGTWIQLKDRLPFPCEKTFMASDCFKASNLRPSIAASELKIITSKDEFSTYEENERRTDDTAYAFENLPTVLHRIVAYKVT